jgi:hypothetical protein
VIDALAHVEHAVGGSLDSTQRQLEQFQRGLVGLSLLSGDDFVKFDSEQRTGAVEEIVVHVGEDGQAEAGLELAERGDSIGPGLPGGQ